MFVTDQNVLNNLTTTTNYNTIETDSVARQKTILPCIKKTFNYIKLFHLFTKCN